MLYVGVDLHKDQLTVVGKNALGEVVLKTRLPCRCVQRIQAFFEGLPRPFRVAVEAVGFYEWFWDLVEPLADRMILANATEVRHRSPAEPKTDYRDARRLAELLRQGLFDLDHHLRCYVPDLDLRHLRHLTRRRNNLTRRLVAEKNSFRRITLRHNLAGPETLDSLSAARWTETYTESLSDDERDLLRQLADAMAMFERHRTDLERRIAPLVKTRPDWRRTVESLDSLPGFGSVVTWTLLAEIGDFARFDRPEELVNYVGLDPRVFQSDATVRHGRITKTGPRDARWVLIQAAWVAATHDGRCQGLLRRISKRAGRKKAAVAVARKLLVWAWYLVRSGQSYQDNRRSA
jgi:transposase